MTHTTHTHVYTHHHGDSTKHSCQWFNHTTQLTIPEVIREDRYLVVIINSLYMYQKLVQVPVPAALSGRLIAKPSRKF